jgi:acetyltransferase-like isoleucine patch superfamily enzyme
MSHVPFFARLSTRLHRWASATRVWRARAAGARIAADVAIAPACDLRLGFENSRRGRLEIGAGCELEPGVVLRPHGGSIRLGANVHLGPGVVIYGHGGVEIGNDCLVAMHARILSSEHTLPPLGTLIRSQPDILKPTRLGRDVWLGAGVTVLGGVTIADGCVIGAGAVVTGDLPPGAIAVGVPARIVGHRTSASSPSVP